MNARRILAVVLIPDSILQNLHPAYASETRCPFPKQTGLTELQSPMAESTLGRRVALKASDAMKNRLFPASDGIGECLLQSLRRAGSVEAQFEATRARFVIAESDALEKVC